MPIYDIKSDSCAMPMFQTVQEVEEVRKDRKPKGVRMKRICSPEKK